MLILSVDISMKTFIAILLTIVAIAHASPTARCSKYLQDAGLSSNFNESIAHAIHSMTVQGLQLFNRRANENNKIPTVNHNLHVEKGARVLMYAPNDPLPSDYFDFTMNMIDKVRRSFLPSQAETHQSLHVIDLVDGWQIG